MLMGARDSGDGYCECLRWAGVCTCGCVCARLCEYVYTLDHVEVCSFIFYELALEFSACDIDVFVEGSSRKQYWQNI